MQPNQIKALSPGGFFFCLLLGVLSPLVTIVVEIETSMCADVFFDPIPTIWYVVAVSFVPFSNLFLCVVLLGNKTRYYRISEFLNGICLFFCFFYVVVFLPMLPLAAFAIILYGMGLLPMAPLFSFVIAVILRFKLGSCFPVSRKILCAGIGTAILYFVLLEAPMALTQIALRKASSSVQEESTEGIRLLRSFGNNDLMLRSCYIHSDGMLNGIGFFSYLHKQVKTEDAQRIYYRVTGIPFYEAPVPHFYKKRFPNEFEWDEGIGGQEVLGTLQSLSMTTSSLDGSIDSDAAIGYLEWTMVFKNEHLRFQREARMRIEVPSGSVVSRLTLWIDGKEKEAVFAAKADVRRAYETVVRQRRDPVLVTLQGDTLLVQCFPVLPQGEMKIRLGITFPLEIQDLKYSRLRLPSLTERNFSFSPQLRHSLWISSKNPIVIPTEQKNVTQVSEKLYELKSMISEEEWSKFSGNICLERSPDVFQTWVADGNEFILQTLQEMGTISPGMVVFVMDASRCMAPYVEEITNATMSPDSLIPRRFVVASDTVLEYESLINKTGQNHLKLLDMRGGCDNVPALARAWDIGSQNPGSVLVWIHGPQPALLSSLETLSQRVERSACRPAIYSLPIQYGSNRIREALDTARFISIPRTSSLSQDIGKILSRWNVKEKQWTWIRERVQSDMGFRKIAKQTSFHLARLWAYEQVLQLHHEDAQSSEKKAENHRKAVELAEKYRIVSPVSGAVVLENKQQYEAAGLYDGPATTPIPTIPEPEMWLLLLIIMAVLICISCKRRRFSKAI